MPGGCRPAAQRRDRAGDRPDIGVEPRHPFHWRIDDDIQERRQQDKESGQQIDSARQDQHAGQNEADTVRERLLRRDEAGGQRAVSCPFHHPVDVAFDVIIEDRRSAGGAAHAQQRQEQRAQRMNSLAAKKIAERGGNEHHRDDARF